MNFLGFTLVELIVVITILVILGTIAFLNLGGFSASARDSGRVQNLANLHKGLSIFQLKSGTYPMPEGSVNISASGVVIGYQWSAKDQTSSLANLSKWGTTDPSDAAMYTTYTVNASKNKMQVMAFLEDGSTVTSYIPQTFASNTSDYSKRTPIVRGDSLGIILSNTGTQPLQETGTGVDVVTTQTGYTLYIGKDQIVTGTGIALLPILTNYDSTIGNYPGCNMKDIKLANGQVWAACNAGATTAYAGTAIADCAGGTTDCNAWIRSTVGGFYQWGRNDDISATGTPTAVLAPTGTLAGWVGHTNFIQSGAGGYDWISVRNDNLWGGSGTTFSTGTYVSQGSPASMQGACASGYHVPTMKEWCLTIISTVNPAMGCNSSPAPFNNTSLVSLLKLPLVGNRDYDSKYYSQSTNGYYWSSTPEPNNPYGRAIGLSSSQVTYDTYNRRSFGYSVRCIKN